MGLITNAQNLDLRKVSHCPFSKNQHVTVPSNTPINIKEISGCSINSRTWTSMRNFAAELSAELVPFRPLKCLEMGVSTFPQRVFSLRHVESVFSQYSLVVRPLRERWSVCVYGVGVWPRIIATIRGNDCT